MADDSYIRAQYNAIPSDPTNPVYSDAYVESEAAALQTILNLSNGNLFLLDVYSGAQQKMALYSQAIQQRQAASTAATVTPGAGATDTLSTTQQTPMVTTTTTTPATATTATTDASTTSGTDDTIMTSILIGAGLLAVVGVILLVTHKT